MDAGFALKVLAVATRLPARDAVIIGLGWTGSILAEQLTASGLKQCSSRLQPGQSESR